MRAHDRRSYQVLLACAMTRHAVSKIRSIVLECATTGHTTPRSGSDVLVHTTLKSVASTCAMIECTAVRTFTP